MVIKSFINKKPFIVAGPCSAESEDQIMGTALKIKNNIDVFRAGIWKPRTNPNSFEGVGEQGLVWLKKVKKEIGLKVITEVATPKHVEKCLEANIDMLWIGARTTVNPFYVQEISEALSGVDIPVFVKNPIHPEIGLWTGALERLNKKGINRIGAIHRGFFTYESSAFRNDPKWEMPIELKRNFPQIPIICDPSHIAGNSTLISELSQIAMDLDMNGLMIETHENPKRALSDANQQLTTIQLNDLLDSLVLRKIDFEDNELIVQLKKMRDLIGNLDQKTVDILNLRTDLVKEIAEFKLKNNLTIFQINRWFEILEMRKKQARNLGMDEKMIRDIYELIHKYSIITQTRIMKK